MGDIFGRRRLFLIGMAAFAGGSAVATMSDAEEALVAGRVLQGLGGAALLGLSLAIVSTVVLDDDRHAGRAEPEAFASALSASTWLLVGLCAVGTVLTWAFVRASDEAAVAHEHQAPRHFHLPWTP